MEAYAEYSAWAHESLGVKSADGIAVAALPPPHFRGVIATKPVAKGRPIISVPLAATLSLLDLPASPVNALIDELGRRGIPIGEDNALALMLLHEKKLGAASKYRKHVEVLPSIADIRSPFSYTDDELAAYEGTNLGPYAKAMRAQLRADHAAISAALGAIDPTSPAGAAGLTPEIVTQDALCWALSNIWSRFVSLTVNRRLIKAMIPFFDLLNHDPAARTRHAYDPATGCVTVTSESALPAGSQVCLYYGDLSSYEMARLYGMSLPRQPESQRCLLQMALPNSLPHFGERTALLAQFCGPAQGNVGGGSGAGAARPTAASRSGESTSIGSTQFGKFEMVGSGGGAAQLLRAEFDLSHGSLHKSLLRAMRILNAQAEPTPQPRPGGASSKAKAGDAPARREVTHFAALERMLIRSPDGEVSPAHEAAVLGMLLGNLRGMLAERTAPLLGTEGAIARDEARVAALQATADAGGPALEAFFDGLRARGVVKGPKPSPSDATAGPSSTSGAPSTADDSEDLPSLFKSGASLGKGSKAGGKGGKGGKSGSGPAAAAPAKLAPEGQGGAPAASTCAADATPLSAPTDVPLLPPGEYVLALAASLRAAESRVLASHIGMLEGLEAGARKRAGQVSGGDESD